MRSLRRLRRELAEEADRTFEEIIPEAEKRIAEAFHEAEDTFDEQMVQDFKAAGKEVPWEKLPVYEAEPEKPQIININVKPPEPQAEVKIKERIVVKPPSDDHFFNVPRERLEIVVKDVKTDLNIARYAAAQRAGSIYEEIIRQADVMFQSGTLTMYQAMERAANQAAAEGLNCIEYKDGRRVNVASYVEMALRTSAHRAALTAQGAKRDQWGIHTVTSPTLHSTCESCLQWQGKILIDDVYSSGTREDGPYPFVSEAIKPPSHFLGPNCRHPLVTYIEGVTQIPTQSPLDRTLKSYEAEQKQRYIERMIRRWKRAEAIAVTDEQRESAKRQVRLWQAQMRKHLKENPQLRRIPQREKLLGLTPFEKRPGDPSTILEVAQKQAEILKQISDHQPDLRMSLKKGSVSDMTYWEHDGKRYEVDGKHVVLDYSKKEREIAEWYAEKYEADVKMVPRINYPQRIKTPDYKIDGNNWDLKEPTGNGKNTIDGVIKESSLQSKRFIIDLSKSTLTNKQIKEQVERITNNLNREWLEEMIVLKDGKILHEYRKR